MSDWDGGLMAGEVRRAGDGTEFAAAGGWGELVG